MTQKEAESRFGALAGMGSYCTEYVVDPYTGQSKWPGLLRLFQAEEWVPGGRSRAWVEGVAQGRSSGWAQLLARAQVDDGLRLFPWRQTLLRTARLARWRPRGPWRRR